MQYLQEIKLENQLVDNIYFVISVCTCADISDKYYIQMSMSFAYREDIQVLRYRNYPICVNDTNSSTCTRKPNAKLRNAVVYSLIHSLAYTYTHIQLSEGNIINC